ncbi:MAG TPA: NYN domain-containing protein [Pyrinomonadaceae bacterium]|jgi:uncharacterized LabA/DUF88 family protein
MANSYLFIDGGHLRRYYAESVRKWFEGEGTIDFARLKQTLGAGKSFYYDCLDDIRRAGETQAAFDSRIEQQEAYFNKIREVVGSHVRLGSLTGTAKNKRQKEVDILLTVDMMNHAVRGNMSTAYLLSGDRDFKPVVESLVQMGLFVEVIGDRKHTSKDLAWAADNYTGISFDRYHEWSVESLKKKYPINIPSLDAPPSGANIVEIEEGVYNGAPVTLYKWQGNTEFYLHVPQFYHSNGLTLQFHDPDV